MSTREESNSLTEEIFSGLKGDLYRVDRLYNDSYDRDELLRGISKEAAMKHCQDPETSSVTCTTAEGKARTEAKGEWFDSWTIDMEATYKVGQVFATTMEEYEERLNIMPPAMQERYHLGGNIFDCFAMVEPIYHTDNLDAGRSNVAVTAWYFRCKGWGTDSDRCFSVNDTLSSRGRNRALLAVQKAYGDVCGE